MNTEKWNKSETAKWNLKEMAESFVFIYSEKTEKVT